MFQRNKNRSHTSQTVGLDIALAVSNFVTGKDNMHYGIWDNLNISLDNLGVAQEAYTKRLLSYLPNKKKLKILDIGGGAGETAKLLISLGHKVTIIVPSPVLASHAEKNTDGQAKIELCTFENYNTNDTNKFDVCLFSESLQYISLEIGLKKAKHLLAPKGKIIISDCFRSSQNKNNPYRPPGGGHYIGDMYKLIAKTKLEITAKEDITSSVAASIDLEQKFYNVIGFAVKRTKDALKLRYPILTRLMIGFYILLLSKKRRDRFEKRLFEKSRTSEVFKNYNNYMIFSLISKL